MGAREGLRAPKDEELMKLYYVIGLAMDLFCQSYQLSSYRGSASHERTNMFVF